MVSTGGTVSHRLCIWFLALLGFLAAMPAAAHPGTGIVRDEHGNIYYTDLAQVWRVAPDGTRTIAVPDVHTHEVYLDRDGNLYGEHVWYEGEATDRYGSRVWRRSPGGRIEDVVPATTGFRRDYSFVRDAAGTMYWADGGRVWKRPAGSPTAIASEARFGDIRSMTVGPTGTVHLIDGEDLVAIAPGGKARRVAASLAERTILQPFVNAHHRVMGLWGDPEGNIYVAVWGGQLVKKVDPAGRVSVAARSTFPWSPSGGMVAPDGRLWLLEYSVTNQVRIRPADEARSGQLYLWLTGALALLALPVLAIRAWRRRRRV
jgi:streptogramin lyase